MAGHALRAALFLSFGVNALDGGVPCTVRKTARFTIAGRRSRRPEAAWVDATRGRLASWGFNSAGGWSLAPQELRLPTIVNLELGRNAKFHWFDPFAPETEQRMMALARKLVAPYRDSPYRIGYFSDNEVGWWAGALFVFYSMKPADSMTKQRWVETLRRHYSDDWTKFVADFMPPAGRQFVDRACSRRPR